MPDFLQYPDRQTLMENIAEDVADQLEAAILVWGSATLAVPGGTTPAPFLTLLSKTDLDWSKVNVMLTDERFVPESSERSNTRLLRDTLLQNNAAVANLVPFYKDADTPEDVLEDLTRAITAALPIDVCVLGMGEDMHTASLFPEADRLEEGLDLDGTSVLLPMRAPGAPEPRLTLTASVLQAARNIHILITGEGKKTALEAAMFEGPASEAPIRVVLDAPGQVDVHYAD
ncbi:6-phosphogluconolactonase [Rhodobacterales bacterium 52_120_T64]|nr:6-phosphogluconolactonase [Rhodobacterales bacterium 52_120_T64]